MLRYVMKTKNCLFILSISLFIVSCGEKNSNENKYGEVTSEEFKDYAKHFTTPKDSKKYDIEGKLTNGEMSFDSMPNITNKFHAEFDSNLDTSITKDYKLDGNLKFTTESNSDYTIDYYFKLNNSQNDNYSLSVVPSEGKENSYEIDKQTFENNVSNLFHPLGFWANSCLLIADFSIFKSSMILFWVAILSSSKVKKLAIFFCSAKQGFMVLTPFKCSP